MAAAIMKKPRVVHVIPSTYSAVAGIAALDSRIFVLYDRSEHIFIYDASDFTELGKVTVSELKDPKNIVICAYYNSLYVTDADSYHIHKVELNKDINTNWALHKEPRGLSLTKQHNLLVVLPGTKQIQEYTTNGSLVREINLDDSLFSPVHCLELSNGQFVICHGWSTSQHRVCVVDSSGRVVRSYGGSKGSSAGQLDNPVCLAMDSSEYVLVADLDNHAVRLFSPSLIHLGDITLPGVHLRYPRRIYFDVLNKRLYIGERVRGGGGGRLFVITEDSGD